MAPQTIFVLDQGAREEIESLHRKIDRLMHLISARAPSPEEDEWLTAGEFCRRYKMGRSTLTRRLSDPRGLIEVKDTGGKKSLYRWANKAEGEDAHADEAPGRKRRD